MKTDSELNQLIAERVMGYVYDGSAWWTHPDGQRTSVDGLPRYCTDPSAWGALFDLLCEQGRNPTIRKCRMRTEDQKYRREATVLKLNIEEDANGYLDEFAYGYHRLTGRALVLATLAAYGMEVTE